MKILKIQIIGILTFALCLGFLSCKKGEAISNPEAEKAAVESATAWLALTDDGDYDTAYEEASEYFKNAVTKEKLNESMTGVRTPLGKLIKREVIGKKYTTTAPGAPDGEYVIIQFKAEFENKKEAIETVTPMKEKDNSWRVSGYYIK